MDNQGPISSRTMMEIRLADAEKDYWEAKYMIDEALFLKEIAKSDNKKLVYSALEKAGLLAGEGGTPTATFRFPEKNKNTRCVALRMPNEELLGEPVEEVVKVSTSRFVFETPQEDDLLQQLANAVQVSAGQVMAMWGIVP